MANLEDRFWKKVDIKGPDDCWEWNASKSSNGYGCFKYNTKTLHSHRVSYEIANSSIPEGKMILHKCDNKGCCNPNHLYAGTHSDNIIDSMTRHPEKIGKKRGKLYAGEIWLIRKLKLCKPNIYTYKKYKYSAVYIGKMFKVDNQTILNIWQSDKWLCKEGYYI
jgi:hypothetical protein